MLRVALRGLMGRRMRLLLTALAISLGVAFVAGTYVLTDTMNYAFNDLFGRISAKTDVVVKSQSQFSSSMMQQTERNTVPQSALDKVKEVPGVQAAQGTVSGFAQIVGNDRRPITTTGAPTFGISNSPVPELATWTLKDGRAPFGFDEMAVDKHTADANGLKVGKQYQVLFQGPTRTFTLVGTFGFGDLDSMAGATVAVFDLPTAQVVLDKPNAFDSIEVRAAPGVPQATLRDRVAKVLGSGYDVATGATDADRTATAITDSMSFISTGMLIFAGVALFVGAFIIVNTFSIIVAQRVREFGLLRALGAGSGQVVMSVVLEALVIGVLSSAAGLLMGLGVAKGLYAMFSLLGMDMPAAALQVEARTVLVAIGVGVGVTVVASVLPALRAGRVPPIAALQAGFTSGEDRVSRRRVVTGVLVTAAGLGALLFGMYATISDRMFPILVGAVVLFLGAASLSGLVARPMAAAIGWPVVRLFRVPGKLGRANAMRSPSRTARTAAALMVGLALVAFVSVFGASMKASATDSIDNVLRADYVLTGANAMQAGFSPEVVRSLEAVPQVRTVAEIRAGTWLHNGREEVVGGAVAVLLSDVMKLERIDGNIVRMGVSDVLVSQSVAHDQGLRVGDTITVWMPVSGQQKLWVSGIYKAQGVSVDYMVALPTFQAGFTQQLDVMVAVKLRDGVSTTQARPAIDAALTSFPNVKLQDSAQYKADQEQQINQILNYMYILLALAVIIALFGIVNTLALSVFERVRELGLLRAVGMTRSDIEAMVVWEAVIVALIGAVLGIAVGCVFGFMAVRAVPTLTTFAIPFVQLAVFVVAAALAGVLAAVGPAMRAAKVDVLKAIATT